MSRPHNNMYVEIENLVIVISAIWSWR